MRSIAKICGIILLFAFHVINGQYKARIWDTRDGLSNNWISDIAQDDKGYIWLATQYGLNRFDGYSFESFTHDPEDNNSPIANWVKRIAKKSKQELWLGIDYGGLDLYNIDKNKFSHQTIIYQNDTITSINKLLNTKNEILYVGTDNGLFIKSRENNDFRQLTDEKILDIRQDSEGKISFLTTSALYSYSEGTNRLKKIIENTGIEIRNIFIDSEDRLFALKNEELLIFKFSNDSYKIAKILAIDRLVSLLFADNPIIEDSEHRVWIGGETGISIVDKNRNRVQFHPYETLFQKDIVGVQALSFFEDIHKNIWIGTNKGLALISTFTKRFQSNDVLSLSIDLKDMREFHQVNDNLLIGANEGLFYVNREKIPRKILSEKIYGMHLAYSGALYGVGNGLFEIDTSSFEVKELSNSYVKGGWSITEDKGEDLWLVGNSDLIRYRKDSGTFETFNKNNTPTLRDSPRVDLLIDSKGNLWVCTLRSGVYLLENPHELELGETPVFKNINHEPENTKSLSNRLATALLETSDGTIWIGTDAGLNSVDPETFEVRRYLKDDGLKDEKIMALVEDDFGNIWGSTVGNGIFLFDKKDGFFSFFGQEDGLKSSNFLLSSAYKAADGMLYFGADNGMEQINPSLFKEFNKPKIDFFLTHAQLPSQSDNKTLRNLDREQDSIVFDYDDNSFSVSYTTLNYHLAEKTNYQYKVDNLSDAWQDNGGERSITFNSLSPGEYNLEVAAINPDLDFENNVIRLKIVVRPPWWRTNLAYLGYFLFLLSLLFAIHKYLLARKLNNAEKNRLKELDAFKTKFFNNVAHELKTPLTLISGMAKTLLKKGNNEISKSVITLVKSSDELNDLVNQILDLSKLEVGKLELNLVHGDIIQYLRYIMSSFESLASAKEIRLHFLASVEELYMDFDARKVKHVFSNLFSNAIKNTPVKGDIYLQITNLGTQVKFVVKDNGKGISEEDQKMIFERYHQAKGQMGGTGIGLSFTKELIELMNGSISVKSKLDKGSSFEVILPIEHNALKIAEHEHEPTDLDYSNIQPEVDGSTKEAPMIQIIEDNLDICSYLGFILKQDYQLNFSHTGNDGLKNVIETLPDLVIMDLMMPGKDGFEVCKEIKTNPITDHIPVIMLTAKSDTESKLKGLQLGADVYLEKPFDEKELLLRISKLLEQREILRNKYRNPEYWKVAAIKSENETNEFLLRIKELIDENIADSRFGILELCRSLGISRSHLHRKLKALTNLSTSAFILTIRLQKAHQLLKTTEKNVSEVAYEIGFEDPAYFSRQFSKRFGYPPSETRKTL